MAVGNDILIWLLPLIVILIAVFILWIVSSIIRTSKFKELSEEDVDRHNKRKKKDIK